MTEQEILEKLPKITSEKEYKEYEKRMAKGEALIANRWKSQDKKVREMIKLYSFICGRMLEYKGAKILI